MPLILNGTTGVSGIDGSAGTPSYVGGDSDTGLWYPAANTVALSTSGSERLRIDSSGNVGIGTSSPSVRLQLSCSQASSTFPIISNNTSDTATSINGIHFPMSNGSSGAQIYIRSDASGGDYTMTIANGQNQPIRFCTSSTTERMRIDQSGNVGIGTATPDIYSTGLAKQFTVSTTTTNGYAVGTFAGGANVSGGVEFGNQTIRHSGIYGLDGSGVSFWTNATNSGSGLTERMRITSGGQLLVGATTSQVFSGVTADHAFIGPTGNGRWVTGFRNSGNSTPWGIVVGYSGASPNNTSQDFIWCEDTTAQRAAIRSNGGLANYSANNSNLSDRREKTNFAPAKNYIDIICSIPVQTFNYIDQNLEEDDGLTLGVVAQDVQAVAPELVTESNWGTEDNPKMRLSIYQTDLQYALMKCIQEQQAMIEELKAKVAALEK